MDVLKAEKIGKTQKDNPLKTKRVLKSKYSYVGAGFLHLPCQRAVRTPALPSVTPLLMHLLRKQKTFKIFHCPSFINFPA